MVLLTNKKARFEYEIGKTYTAGLLLTGAEVKSLRLKMGSLTGSFVKILGDELFLLNAQIPPYAYADNREYDPKRSRKLLLTRHEIDQLRVELQRKGVTLVPLVIETAGRFLKLSFGVGRGKKQYEKRAALKEKDLARELARTRLPS